MAWLAVDKNGTEKIFNYKPVKLATFPDIWSPNYIPGVECYYIKLPKGSIRRLINKDITWNDEPIRI